MTDKDRLLMYEGKDPNLRENPCCSHCSETPATKLLRCSRCHVAWYCIASCQKKHYAKHQDLCKRTAHCKKRVLEEEAKLRHDPEENIFETEIGNFFGLRQTASYMDVTYALANWYSITAYQSEVKEVWEKSLFHLLEHLRLGAIDHMGARLRAPYFLLYLNRDDDSFSFIRYWVQLEELVTVNPDAIFDIHLNSKEGDWIYPREADCRYLDLFEHIPEDDLHGVELPLLVALAIIKLRIVAAHDAAAYSIKLALEGSAGRRIQEVQFAIEEMIIRQDVNVESQREQVHRLLDAIHLQNPSMLPALVNPKPLTDQQPPMHFTPGHPSEVYRTLVDCQRCFDRIPGAMDLLRARFGNTPVYNWSMT